MVFILYKMIFYLTLCNILFIPIIYCSNTTVSKSDIINNTLPNSQHEKQSNRTKEPILSAKLSEGGSILPETLVTALTESNNTKLNNNETSKNKVVPRKGVIYPGNATNSQDPVLSNNANHTTQPSTSESKLDTQLNDTNVLKEKSIILDKLSKDPKVVNKTKAVLKPLILRSDMLENQTVKASPDTVVNNEHLLVPNKDIKSYVTNATKHPGMVMPIVITILLVPMFAVLGYMALRRGQEAWKNRHYKRMDFLLDGMYND